MRWLFGTPSIGFRVNPPEREGRYGKGTLAETYVWGVWLLHGPGPNSVFIGERAEARMGRGDRCAQGQFTKLQR
jgi:hypothetical protein